MYVKTFWFFNKTNQAMVPGDTAYNKTDKCSKQNDFIKDLYWMVAIFLAYSANAKFLLQSVQEGARFYGDVCFRMMAKAYIDIPCVILWKIIIGRKV
jgi:hypothetical protein